MYVSYRKKQRIANIDTFIAFTVLLPPHHHHNTCQCQTWVCLNISRIVYNFQPEPGFNWSRHKYENLDQSSLVKNGGGGIDDKYNIMHDWHRYTCVWSCPGLGLIIHNKRVGGLWSGYYADCWAQYRLGFIYVYILKSVKCCLPHSRSVYCLVLWPGIIIIPSAVSTIHCAKLWVVVKLNMIMP